MKKIILLAVTLIASMFIFVSCQTSSCNCGLGQNGTQAATECIA